MDVDQIAKDEDMSPFGEAIAAGDGARVEVLLAQGAKVNALASKFYGTPLQVAIDAKQEAIQRLLVERGADLKAKGGELGQTILHDACDENIRWLIERALAAGADVNAVDAQGRTPLYRAKDAWTAEQLLARGAKVEVRDEDGRTPLLFTIGHDGVTPVLRAHGADLGAVDGNGVTLLQEAARFDDLALVKELLERGHPQDPDHYGYTPLHSAAAYGNVAVARVLLAAGAAPDARAKSGESPLYQAVSQESPAELVALLLDAGADLSVTTDRGSLFDLLFEDEIGSDQLEVARLLIERGKPTPKQLQAFRRAEQKVAALKAKLAAFDWAPLSDHLIAATTRAVAGFAREHADEVFSAFGFDCNAQEGGEVLFCLNTEARARAQADEAARWNPGDWAYQEFASLNDDKRWRGLVKPLGRDGLDRASAEALLLAIARAAFRLDGKGAFAGLKRTSDFAVWVSDHDETLEVSQARMNCARAAAPRPQTRPLPRAKKKTPTKRPRPAKPKKRPRKR
jgi:ankyrin repeat protein